MIAHFRTESDEASNEDIQVGTSVFVAESDVGCGLHEGADVITRWAIKLTVLGVSFLLTDGISEHFNPTSSSKQLISS
jgi:hypothetical protein